MMNNKQHTELFNTDLAWEKLYGKLKEDNLLIPEKKPAFFLHKFLKVAAIFVALVSLSAVGYFYMFSALNTQQILVENNSLTSIKQIQLPDGSILHLNSGAKVLYPKKFEANTREITFEGEAFFEITKQNGKPFVVKTPKAEIKVLGTSFNVNTKIDNKLEVSVTTGKVQVSQIENRKNAVLLTAGQMASVEDQKILKLQNTNKNYLSWKTKQFDFENVEMQQVVKDLNKAYNVNIIIQNKEICSRKLRTHFDNKPLETILKVIAEPYNLTIKYTESAIILE
jgi:ferric-dicitrate binding protein FerR (iron transport regulator)